MKELFAQYPNAKQLAEHTNDPIQKVMYGFKPFLVGKMMELSHDGVTRTQIGQEVGMHRKTVGSWLNEKDVKEFMDENQDKVIDKGELEEFLMNKFPRWFGVLD
ncbi:MAG: hypothetical protein ACXAD7_14780 [Candidatus Kariarchaeaceae archaeon]|jgi:hypothetical protein